MFSGELGRYNETLSAAWNVVTHVCGLPAIKNRGMHAPAMAMITRSAGVSQLLLAMSTRLWKIVKACRKGDTFLPSARANAVVCDGEAVSSRDDSDFSSASSSFEPDTFVCIRPRKMSSTEVPWISYDVMP